MEYNTPSSGPETPKRAVVDKIKGAERYGLGKASGQGGFFESQWGVFHGGVFESKVFFYYCVGAFTSVLISYPQVETMPMVISSS
jgi:hypothetical protein